MTYLTNRFGTVSTKNSVSNLNQTAYNILSGTASAGTSTTITLDGSASGTDDIYNGRVITVQNGSGEGQSRLISDYDGTTKVATVNEDWNISPDSTSVYLIQPNSGICQSQATLGEMTLSTNASSVDDFYNNAHVKILEGTGYGQIRLITDYNGTTKVATIDRSWDNQPDTDSLYGIYAEGGLASAGGSSTITLDGNQSSLPTAGHYVEIYSGTGSGQVREIQSIVSNTLTVTASWTTTPDNTSRYVIYSGWGGEYENVKTYSQQSSTIIVDTSSKEAIIHHADLSFDSIGSNVRKKYTEISFSNPPSSHTLSVVTEYYKTRIIGLGTSVTGAIQTIFHRTKSKPLSDFVGNEISKSVDVELTKSVLVGETVDKKYSNLKCNNEGNLQVDMSGPLTSFGEVKTEQATAVAQMSFVYGINQGTSTTIFPPGTQMGMLTEGDGGTAQVQTIIVPGGSTYSASGAGDYFTIVDGDSSAYYIWYDVDSGNSDPAPGGTGIQVDIGASDSPSTVASKTISAVNTDGTFTAAALIPGTNAIQLTNGTVGNVSSVKIGTMPQNGESQITTNNARLELRLGDGTNTGVGDYAVIRSRRALPYKAGQGSLARFTAVFDDPVVGTIQQAGLFNLTASLVIGYNSSGKFGVLRKTGGKAEVRTLSISSGASGSETATVTLDGIDFDVPLTSGSASHNAREIAAYTRYRSAYFQADAIGSDVIFISESVTTTVGPRDKTYAFSSSTAAGTFARTTIGVTATEYFTVQKSFNIDKLDGSGKSGIILNPQKGNVYQIQYQWLGYGAISYAVENPLTGKFVVFHREKYANKNIIPSLNNPHMNIGWVVSSAYSPTALTMYASSGGAFTEGKIRRVDPLYTITATKTTTSANLTPVFTIRNLRTFAGIYNITSMALKSVAISNDANKSALIEFYLGATLDTTTYSYVNEGQSCAVIDTSATTITGGTVAYRVIVGGVSTITIDISQFDVSLQRGEKLTMAVQRSTTTNVEITTSLVWVEDQ